MSDVNANIGVQIDTSLALAELKNLQRQLANFHSSISKSSASAALAQKNLQNNLLNAINETGKFRAQMGVIRTSTESFTDSLEKNKFGMREYFRYAGGASKSFGRLFRSEFETINRVATERVKDLQTQYIKMGRDASGAMRAIAIRPLALDMENYATKTQIAAQRQALFNQLVKQGSTSLLNFGKNTQWAGRQLMVGFSIPLAYLGTAAAKTFMTIEEQVVRFKRVYGELFTSTEETTKVLDNVRELAKEFTKYGVAVETTIKVAADAAAAGKMGVDLIAQVQEATRLAVLGQVEQAQALETTISLQNAFGQSAEQLAQDINFLNAVENQTVTSIEDLTIAIPKAGPVVKQLGGDVKDLAYFLTAMKEGGINASEGANALKSGLASLINPTAKASAMLADMGVNITDIVERNKGDLRTTVEEFAAALDTLAPLERSRAIEQLFGKFQFARLSTLFQNVAKEGNQAARVLKLAGASVEELAILSERELKAVEDAIGVDFKEAVQQLRLALEPIGKMFLKTITPIAKVIANLLDKFNGLDEGTQKFIVVVSTLVGVVGPTLLMTFGLIGNALANTIKLFASLRNGFLRLGGNSKVLSQQTQYMTTEQAEAAGVAAALNQAHNRLVQTFTVEATAVQALRNAYVSATTAATQFAMANPGMMVPGAGRVPKKKFASGTTEVVGGEAGKDSVPALLMPGEAVIPTAIAQDDRFKPLIAALVSGDIAKYSTGTTDAGSKLAFGHAVDLREVRGQAMSEKGKAFGFKKEHLYTAIGFNVPEKMNADMRSTTPNTALGDYRLAIQNKESLRTMTGRLIDSGIPPRKAHAIAKEIRNNLLKATAGLPANTLINDDFIYKRMGNDRTGIIGSLINSRNPITRGAVKELFFGGSRSMGGTLKLDDVLDNMRSSSPGARKSLVPIRDVISATTGKIDVNAGRVLSNIQRLYPDAQLEVIKDKKGNIVAFQRPELKPDNTLSQKKGTIGLLVGNKFETQRTLGSSDRAIKISDPASRAFDKMIGKKVAIKPGQQVVDINTGKKTTAKRVPLTKEDKKRIPAKEKLSHRKAVMVRRGQAIPPLGATAETGYNAQNLSPAQKLAASEKISLNQAKKILAAHQKYEKSIVEATKAQLTMKDKVRELSGKASVGAGAITGMAIAASFAGGKVGEMAQSVLPFAFAIQGIAAILPMLTNPWGLMIAAVVGVGAVLWKMNKDLDKAREEGIAMGKAMVMTKDKLIELSKITGTVSASEEADKKRENLLTGASAKQRKTGQTILESDFGKGFVSDIQMQKTAGATNEQVASSIANGLSTAIMQGVLTTDQARSMAAALGEKLGSYDIPLQVSGKITQIFGPNGENLANNPLQVALAIKKDSMNQQAQAFQNALANRKSTVPGVIMKGGVAALAGTGAAVGAGIGAGFGGVGAVPGAAIGAVAGTAVAGAAGLYALTQQNKLKQHNLKLDTAAIQLGIEAVSQGQGLLDSINAQYDDKIKLAKTDKEISDLEAERKKAIDAVNKENAKTLDILIKQKDSLDPKAFDAAIKAAADTMYKEGPMAVFKDQAIETLKGLEDSDFKAQLQLGLASGDVDPNQIISFVEMAKNNPDLQMSFNAIVKTSGLAELNVLTGLLDMSGASEKTYKIIMDLVAANPGQMKDIQEAVSTISNILPKYGITVDINTVGADKLKQIQKSTNDLEALASKGPITQKVIQDLRDNADNPVEAQMYQDILTYWTDLVGSQKSITKEMTIDFIATYSDDNVRDFVTTSRAGGAGVPQHIKDYVGAGVTAGSASAAVVGDPKNEKGKTKGDGTTPGDGKERDTSLDDLLKRLRAVRDASINVEGGIGTLLSKFKKTGGEGWKAFKGIENAMLNVNSVGRNREFMDYLSGLDKKALGAYVNTKKLSQGIFELTAKGKALQMAFNDVKIGEYVKAQQDAAKITNAQRIAFDKLIKSGMSAELAMQVVADGEMAVAINTKAANGELKKFTKQIVEADNVMKRNAFVEFLRSSEVDVQKKLNLAGIIPQLKQMGMTFDQIQEVLDNPTIADGLIAGMKQGKVQAQDVLNLLNQMERTRVAKLIIQVEQQGAIGAASDDAQSLLSGFNQIYNAAQNLVDLKYADDIEDVNKTYEDTVRTADQTFADASKSAQDLIDKAEQAIAVEEDKLKVIQGQIAEKQKAIDAAQKEIDAIDEVIDGYQKQIDILQRKIELDFDRPIEALQDSVDAINREIELDFDRPIEALQEESSDLSNDLALIDQAAEQINKKYDAQVKALEQVQKVNEQIINQQKQQIGLADALSQGDISAAAQIMQDMRASNAQAASGSVMDALEASRNAEIAGLRSASGMTREQIEKRQFEISQQIYALEEKREAKQLQIRTIQDQIYKLEQGREVILRQIRDYEDKIYQQNLLKEPIIAKIKGYEKEMEVLRETERQQEEAITKLRETKLKQAEEAMKAAEKAHQDALKKAEEKKKKDLEAIEEKKKKEMEAFDAAKKAIELIAAELLLANLEANQLPELMNKAKKYGIDLANALKSIWTGVDLTIPDEFTNLTPPPPPGSQVPGAEGDDTVPLDPDAHEKRRAAALRGSTDSAYAAATGATGATTTPGSKMGLAQGMIELAKQQKALLGFIRDIDIEITKQKVKQFENTEKTYKLLELIEEDEKDLLELYMLQEEPLFKLSELQKLITEEIKTQRKYIGEMLDPKNKDYGLFWIHNWWEQIFDLLVKIVTEPLKEFKKLMTEIFDLIKEVHKELVAASKIIVDMAANMEKIAAAAEAARASIANIERYVLTIHEIRTVYTTQGSPPAAPAPGTPAPGTPAPGTPAPGTPAPGTPTPPSDPFAGILVNKGGYIKMAGGGTVPGPSVNRDVIPAMLTPGEYVINRNATSKFLPLLQAINGGSYPSLNMGGRVKGMLGFNQGGLVPQKLMSRPSARNMVTPSFNNAMSVLRSAKTPTFSNRGISGGMSNIGIPAEAGRSQVNNQTSAPVYNYSVNVSVGGTNADANTIANVVLSKIQGIEAQKIRTQAVYV